MTSYTGAVRGGVIELDDGCLSEGTPVRIQPKDPVTEELTPEGYRKGSSQAILAALKTMPECQPEDVDALMEVIHASKTPMRPGGVFDDEERGEFQRG